MNKWLQRTVSTVSVAGGVVLLAAGVAQAADGATVTGAAPTSGLAGLSQVLNPTDLVGGATGAVSNSPLGLPNPTGALKSLPGGALLGQDGKHGKHGSHKEAGMADALGKATGAMGTATDAAAYGIDRGVGRGLPTAGLPSVGNLPLAGAVPTGDLNRLDSKSVVADLLSVQDAIDNAPATEGLPLPVGGLDSTVGNVSGGVTGGLPVQDLTGGLPVVGGLTQGGLPAVGGLTGQNAPAPAPVQPPVKGKKDKPVKTGEKKVKPGTTLPAPAPMPRPNPVAGLVGGVPVVGGLAQGPLSTVTNTTGGLPVVGGLTQGGLPVVGGMGGGLGERAGMPVATDLLGGLPLAGDLAGQAGSVLPGDLLG